MSYVSRLIINPISAILSLLLNLLSSFIIAITTASYIFLIYSNYSLENMTPVLVLLLIDSGAVYII